MLHPSDNFGKPAPSQVLDRKREIKIGLPWDKDFIPNPPRIPLFRLQPPISPRLPVSPSPRLPVSPSPRLLEKKGVIKTDLVSRSSVTLMRE